MGAPPGTVAGLPAIHPIEAVHPVERAMVAALDAAAVGPLRQLEVTAELDVISGVRPAFLRAFLLERIPKSKLPVGRFILNGATILDVDDPLDLSGIELKYLVRFTNCRFLGGIDLSDSKIIGFDLISGETSEIFADRLNAEGSLLVRAPVPDERGPLAEPRGGPFLVSRRIRLCGAKIHGNLDLRGCWLSGQGDQERIPLFADGLTVEGNVLLGNGFRANGEVRLNGSQITRNLDCAGATLQSTQRYSLSAAGATVKGSVYLTKLEADNQAPIRFSSIGTIRFDGATINGDLYFAGGIFTAWPFGPAGVPQDVQEDDWYAVNGDGLILGGDMLFIECELQGSVSLIGARVGRDFRCENAQFDFPGEETLVADGIDVAGTTFVHEGTVNNGIFRFVQANLHQGFRARRATFDVSGTYRGRFDNTRLVARLYDLHPALAERRGLCGIYAPGAEVSGTFLWQDIERLPADRGPYDFWLYLVGSTVDVVEDHEESWSKLDRFDVTGCEYARIATPSNDFGWRLRQLDKQYAILNRDTRTGNWLLAWAIFLRWAHRLDEAVRRFKPQPYMQLAKVVRDGGHEAAANVILVQLERNRTRYSNFSPLRQLARHVLDVILRYGFKKFRPIWILLGWAVLSATCFEAAYERGAIVPSTSEHPRVTFNAMVYAIDTLVPIVDLNQKKNWIVEPLSVHSTPAHLGAPLWCQSAGVLCQSPDWGPGLLVFFNTFFGWAMTTFFAAGISGLLRSGREG
jgi:hypothetical protein